MKPEYIDQDVATIVERFGEYNDPKKVCQRIIEAAERLLEEAAAEAEAPPPPEEE